MKVATLASALTAAFMEGSPTVLPVFQKIGVTQCVGEVVLLCDPSATAPSYIVETNSSLASKVEVQSGTLVVSSSGTLSGDIYYRTTITLIKGQLTELLSGSAASVLSGDLSACLDPNTFKVASAASGSVSLGGLAQTSKVEAAATGSGTLVLGNITSATELSLATSGSGSLGLTTPTAPALEDTTISCTGSGSIYAVSGSKSNQAKLGGSGSVVFAGNGGVVGETLDVITAGSGSFTGCAAPVNDVTATIRGSGGISVAPQNKLTATILGSGTVTYLTFPSPPVQPQTQEIATCPAYPTRPVLTEIPTTPATMQIPGNYQCRSWNGGVATGGAPSFFGIVFVGLFLYFN
uniref:Putative auto-transporter adhesin head GIN domain-containing protein n=1 Tax=Mucochytrium quahogii TaxID=96639 RepID=A0A7S2RWP1_9STRA|mmetsp:Transcript_3031/g.4338  ORF Transcript_3031/g.4338 Transcript_3031/m.4338 type:complete len:350 (+) Transcript_3031:143-1192(+)